MDYKRQMNKPTTARVRIIRSFEELDALPCDAIVGKDGYVYQRWFGISDPETRNWSIDPEKPRPAVWGQIADEEEFCPSDTVWHILAECDGYSANHKAPDHCEDHKWCYVYYEGREELGR
jgi:hypothetical protein